MRRNWLAGGLTAALLVTSACSANVAAPAASSAAPGYAATVDEAIPAGGTLDVELPIDIGAATGLDPQLAEVASAWQLMSLVYETLVTIGPDFSVQPGLAESWDTPTPTSYVFHLREGVAFSNGRPMTADDVVGSLERLRASQSVWRGQLGPVSSVEAVDPHTVQVELSTTYTPFLAALANVPASVLPMKEITEGSLDVATAMLGTGPFTVADHRQDVSWRFARNAGYWAAGTPHLEGVNVTIATEDAARVASLQNGRASLATLGNVDSATMLAGARGVEVLGQATTDFYYLMLNSQKPGSKFADPRVRTAINIAMDRDQIGSIALGGLGKPTGVTPAGLPGRVRPGHPAVGHRRSGGGEAAARRGGRERPVVHPQHLLHAAGAGGRAGDPAEPGADRCRLFGSSRWTRRAGRAWSTARRPRRSTRRCPGSPATPTPAW